jgi:hypothetical protein
MVNVGDEEARPMGISLESSLQANSKTAEWTSPQMPALP